ncbi:MAG: DUF3750 domain-containing protein [Pseudomonadota bacterium]
MWLNNWTRKLVLSFLLLVGVGSISTWALSRALTPQAVGEARAPDPAEYSGAVVQVYGADVWGVRGHFAIHTWVATKARGESTYRIYQVIGWKLRRSGTAVSITEGMPDKPWFRSPPILLHQVLGEAAEELIEPIHAAALSYPYAREYTMWPGPNSNSFTAWIGLEVPQMALQLPAKAIGEGWMHANYRN